MVVPRLEEENLQIQSPKGRTLDTYATYMVNTCQGKVAKVILWLYALALDVIRVLDGS